MNEARSRSHSSYHIFFAPVMDCIDMVRDDPVNDEDMDEDVDTDSVSREDQLLVGVCLRDDSVNDEDTDEDVDTDSVSHEETLLVGVGLLQRVCHVAVFPFSNASRHPFRTPDLGGSA